MTENTPTEEELDQLLAEPIMLEVTVRVASLYPGLADVQVVLEEIVRLGCDDDGALELIDVSAARDA